MSSFYKSDKTMIFIDIILSSLLIVLLITSIAIDLKKCDKETNFVIEQQRKQLEAQEKLIRVYETALYENGLDLIKD